MDKYANFLWAMFPCDPARGDGFRLLYIEVDEWRILDQARKAWECGAYEVSAVIGDDEWEWSLITCPYRIASCQPGARCSACTDT